MKNKMLILIFSFIIMFSFSVKAETIINLSDSDKICESVKSNSTLKIYVNKSIMKSSSSDCNNREYYNENNNNSYVYFFRGAKNNEIYIDDIRVKEAKKLNKYAYFGISNRLKVEGKKDVNTTLKPAEKVNLVLKTDNLKSNSYKDLRLKIRYGATGSDIDISRYNSISYYVVTPNKEYGPYKIADTTFVNLYRLRNANDDGYSNIDVYDITSENLLSNIPSGLSITGIKIYPYENYPIHYKNSYTRFFSITLEGNNTYSNGRNYVTVSSASSVIRHNIVNNMMENATVKWRMLDKEVDHYSRLKAGNPVVFKPNGTIFYGMPYTNEVDTTIPAFLSKMNNRNIDINKYAYSYKLPTNYLYEVTATNDAKITTSTKIGNIFYVYENATQTKYKDDATRNANLKAHPYVRNTDYFLGVDCSSSVFLAVARELPYVSSVAVSTLHYDNSQVYPLGGISSTTGEIEKYIRSKGYIKSNEPMTADLMGKYQPEYVKTTYGKTKIYNSYASLVPGDIVDRVGHTRLETGYPYVECNNKDSNGKVVAYGADLPTKYSSTNNCSKYGGINPDKSYVIITEVGADSSTNIPFVEQNDGTYTKTVNNNVYRYASSSKTGWSFTINKKITDLTNIDDYYKLVNFIDNKNRSSLENNHKNGTTKFRVNRIYTFSELYNPDKSSDPTLKDNQAGIYNAYRYKSMRSITSNNKIEVPFAKIILDRDDNKAKNIYDCMKTNKKLKGIISTNYIMEEIKIIINSKSYYIYPNQTNRFSLFTDVKNSSLNNAIKNMNYSGNNKIEIYVKTGPNNQTVQKKAGASNGYIKVITINSKDFAKTTTTTTTTNNGIVSGDVDGNGKVESSDYIRIRKHILKNTILNGEMLKRADVNSDGKVNSSDYIRIKTIIINNNKQSNNTSSNTSSKVTFSENKNNEKDVTIDETSTKEDIS